MVKTNTRLELARTAYREALEAARTGPSREAWTRLLAAGKELSSAQEPRSRERRGGRRGGRPSTRDLKAEPAPEGDGRE
jgi:hypothetical protein